MSDYTTTTTMAEYAAALPAAFAANFAGRFDLIGFRPMSAHQSDAHLFVVIGEREDGTFAKWNYNASAGGFFGGHYDLTLRRALDLCVEDSYASRAAERS